MASPPALDVLLPPQRPPIGPDDVAGLADVYTAPRLPWLRANMVATLDGAATGPDARSGSINDAADHRVFEALRAWADVVLVGAGTVRAEGYRAPRTPDHWLAMRRREGRADHPPLAVVTASGALPDALLTDDPAPWVATSADAPGLARLRQRLPAERLLVHHGPVELAALRSALVGAGLTRILAEGGPTLLGELLGAHLVDELCLTWSPLLVGGPAPRPVDAPGWLDPPTGARLTTLLHADGVLLGRWRLSD